MESSGGSGVLGGLILGIESSCDETAAAVVRRGSEVLSSVVASQMALHANYGGVVPELASREHLRNIVPIVREAMTRAGVGYGDLDAIAVTEGPGLAGALLVGISYAKALAYGAGKPLIGVNHLEGHIHAVLMEMRERGEGELELPLLALVVSGGHTHLYLAERDLVERGDGGVGVQIPASSAGLEGMVALGLAGSGMWRYRNVGRTVDDAAGEAFDKVAKLLGLGYPGGPWIDRLAVYGDAGTVGFTFQQIKTRAQKGAQVEGLRAGGRAASHGRTVRRDGQPGPDTSRTFDFSFSGIKTAVLRYVETQGMREGIEVRRGLLARMAEPTVAEVAGLCDRRALDLIASFQSAVVGNLLRQSFEAAEAFGARGLVVSGGVAANGELRRRFLAEGTRRGLPVAFPSVGMSTDNAAMIAAAAWPRLVAGEFAAEGMEAAPGLRLG